MMMHVNGMPRIPRPRSSFGVNAAYAMFVMLVIFRVVLDLFYLQLVSSRYAYMGFVLDITSIRYLESWIVYLMFAMATRHRIRQPSDIFVLIIILAIIAPLSSMYGMSDVGRLALYGTASGAWIASLLTNLPRVRMPYIQFGRPVALGICVLMAFGALGWIVATGGAANFNLNILEVYDFREDVQSSLTVGVFAYFASWAYKVFNIILMAYALHKGRWLMAAIFIAIQVLYFGFTSAKAALFYPFLILFLYLFLRRTTTLLIIPLALLLVFGIAAIAYYQFDWALPVSLLIRRTFFVNAMNINAYYEFFTMNSHVFWSNSVLSWLSPYQYGLPPPELIGQFKSLGGPHVNNSFFGTGYMHAGLVGVWVYSVMVGLVLKVADSLMYSDLPLWLVVAVTIVPIRTLLVSADLFTALITHGVFLSLVMLFLLRRPRRNDPRHSPGLAS